jgi:hypothetical protein
MSVERAVRIDAEIASIGQFDRTQTWKGKVAVERLPDGRVRVGNPTQSGFETITFSLDDLRQAVEELG